MNLLGSIIKKGIELKAKWEEEEPDVKAAQAKQLRTILETAKNTALGQYYHFENILESDSLVDTFQKRLPIVEYQDIFENWWKQTLQFPNITWPGKPEFFAKSSGTTGSKPKRIPVTEELLNSIRQASIAQLTSISNYHLPEEFFEQELLALSSHTDLEKVGDHQEGEISAIAASNIPFWFEGVYRPGKEIASIKDWDERVERIAKEAPNWQIGAISGIPSWVLLMLKRVMAVNNAQTIHEVWPGLRVYTPGGVAFEPYRKKFEKIFDKEVHILDTYLASEGFFAYTNRPGTTNMKLAFQHGIFFEFIPFNEEGFDEQANLLKDPKVLTLSQVEENVDYALVITTPAGNYRYLIGDLVTFTNKALVEIKITGRTKHFLNVVGSQLSEQKMDKALEQVNKKLNVNTEEYSIAAIEEEDGNFYHEWILGVEQMEMAANEEVAQCIDHFLKENNKNYGVARKKTLNGVKVFQVPLERFYDYQAQNRKKGGQTKTKKLLKQDAFLKFRKYVMQG
jgi:hypothetical protein